MMKPTNLALWLVTIVAAGCLDGQGTPAPTDRPAEVAELGGEGGISGVAVDTQQVPLGNVTIFVDGQERARTDEVGSFRVAPVAPGAHLFAAEKPNYRGFAADVNVEAGAYTKVTVVLEILPGKSPYHTIIVQAGNIQCGASITDPVLFTNGHIALCGAPRALAGVDTGDRFDTEFELGPLEGTNVTGFWGETEWQSTQALGNGMKIIWWIAEPGANDLNPQYRDLRTIAGKSPLRVRITIEDLIDPEADRRTCENKPQCLAQATHYASANNTNAALDLGFAFQQRYTDYLSLFHNTPTPMEYTALPDS